MQLNIQMCEVVLSSPPSVKAEREIEQMQHCNRSVEMQLGKSKVPGHLNAANWGYLVYCAWFLRSFKVDWCVLVPILFW